MKLRKLGVGVAAWLLFMAVGVLLMISGNPEWKAERALQMAVDSRFPDDILDRYYITDAEISALVALDEDGEALLELWERLIIDQEKRFGPPYRIYGLTSEGRPLDVYVALIELVRLNPPLTDRVIQTIGKLNARANFYDVLGNNAVAILSPLLRSPYIEEISFGSLQELLQSIPDGKDYVLSLYKMSYDFYLDVSSKEIYDMYVSIEEENYLELLSASAFMDLGIVSDLENERIGIRNYYHVRALIEDRLAVMAAE